MGSISDTIFGLREVFVGICANALHVSLYILLYECGTYDDRTPHDSIYSELLEFHPDVISDSYIAQPSLF